MKQLHYTVKFDSELGRSLQEYFAKYDACNEAVRKFITEGIKPFRFAKVDLNSEIVPTDSECGGLLAIMLKPDDDTSSINRFLWAHIVNADGYTGWYPRVNKEPRWFPYAQAVEFDPQVKPCVFKDVARFFTTDDLNRCTRLGDKHPLPELSVACVWCYDYEKPSNDDDVIIPDGFEHTDIFAEAKSLCEAWQSLPVIRKGTLARILQLKFKQDKPTKEEALDAAKLSWTIDKENGLYHFHTGLISSSGDFELLAE